MTDLKVSYQLLDEAERSLSSLRQEFNSLQAQDQGEAASLGSADVVSAMAGFVGDWEYHRRELVSSMEALGQMLQDARQKFQSADSNLSTSLAKR
jgi:multidrug resistance efflux pump